MNKIPKIAVIGDPIEHSRSPEIHNKWMEERGIDFCSIKIHAKKHNLGDTLKILRDKSFIGCNVTVPHKVHVMDYLDEIDEHALKLGAVNTIHFKKNKMVGYNTDGPGFVKSVKREWGIDLDSLKVGILGAGGGAGKAISKQLEDTCELFLVNRTIDKINALGHKLSFEDDLFVLRNMDLIINATSSGLNDEVLWRDFKRGQMVYDLFYDDTEFLKIAKKMNCKVANGWSMLEEQAWLALENWFGGK